MFGCLQTLVVEMVDREERLQNAQASFPDPGTVHLERFGVDGKHEPLEKKCPLCGFRATTPLC